MEVPAAVSKLALSKQVPIRIHKVIYHLFDDLRKRISSHLPILEEEDVIGESSYICGCVSDSCSLVRLNVI